MMPDQSNELPIEQQLALSHATGEHGATLETFLHFDRRMAQFVGQSKEGMLTQMRIAWWRDQFARPITERPNGDPILDAIGHHWVGEERALTALVNGWEALLAEPPLPEEVALEFATGRAACFSAMARLASADDREASRAGVLWALADLAARISDVEERAVVRELARDQCAGSIQLPFRLRSLTILGSLGVRALQRGGRDLISGSGDLLHVMRLGMFGR